MQRTAQDWLVLTTLTRHSGLATGVTVGLQFLPLLLLSPYVGVLADRTSKRRLLVGSQSLLGLGALVLGLLVMTHTVRLWEVYLCALGIGIGGALDNPARQALRRSARGPGRVAAGRDVPRRARRLGRHGPGGTSATSAAAPTSSWSWPP